MCGIFGYVGVRDEAPQRVLAGLKKLEYRGYDSWGIAARQNSAVPTRLLVEKHVGKIGQATTTLPAGHAALGHTRWATHGGVTEANAHPHLGACAEVAPGSPHVPAAAIVDRRSAGAPPAQSLCTTLPRHDVPTRR